jgi:CP family cyanate transporter-like MFS transporter
MNDTGRSGLRLWLPIAGAALAVGLVYLGIFAVPPLITTFVDDLGLSHSEAGALMSVCLGGFLVASLVSGRLAARYGPIPVVVAGLVLCGIATACFALADSLSLFLVCRTATGVAGGLVYAPGVSFVTSLLPFERASLGVGVFLCGLSIGGTVAFFATRLLAEALDWRWPFWIFGTGILAGAAIVAAVSGPSSPKGGRTVSARASPMRDVLRCVPFRMLLAALFVALFVAYGVFTWIPPYLDESAGFSTPEISLVSALMTLAGIPATFGIGWLAYRSRRPLAVAAAALALPILLAGLAMTSSPSLGGAAVVATMSAFGVSGGLAPLYATPPVLFRAAGAATASGIAASSGMGGAVASTYLGGWIVGATGGYSTAFWVYATAAAATAFVLVPLVSVSLRRSTFVAA